MSERLKARRLFVTLALAVACGSLVACGEDDKPPAGTAGTTVRMGEFYFRPADLTVPKDAEVTVINEGAVVHTWILKEAGYGTAGVAPGRSVKVDLKGIEPGAYTLYCDQAGHTQAGQSGKLTISP